MGHLFLALGEVWGSHGLAQDTYSSRHEADTQPLCVISGRQSLAQFIEKQNSETWTSLTKHLTYSDLQQLTLQHLKFYLP